MDQRTPRWVKVFGIAAALVAVALVILLLVGGRHGPSRHGAAPVTAALSA